MQKLSLLFLLLTAIPTAQTEVYFTSYPSLLPDGSNIVFTFDGDLWTVSNNGGQVLAGVKNLLIFYGTKIY